LNRRQNEQKKIVANKLNARRSSGPRTAIGKSNSRRNAAKHGLFSQELLFSDIEKAEFQALHRSLQSQLQPTTALQRVALEEILCCTWRCKLATRQEMQHLRALLDIPRDGEAEPEEPRASAAMTKWFGSGRRELNEGIRILKALEQVVRLKGRVPEEWKERLDRAFGVEFYESLVNWPTISLDALLLANQLVRHTATFGRSGASVDDKGSSQAGADNKGSSQTSVDNKESSQTSADNTESSQTSADNKESSQTSADNKESREVILDPVQNLRMVLKLIEQLMGFLRDLARSWETRGSAGPQAAGPTDFAPRYFTTASRDLHRAVDWYAHLKERHL
jgi:hypothetical protein